MKTFNKGMNKDQGKELSDFEYKTLGNMKLYQVWTEGYAVSGGSSTATYHGECLAESFQEACEKIFGDSLDKNKDGTNRYPYPSVWGCGCYDNELDARKSFG